VKSKRCPIIIVSAFVSKEKKKGVVCTVQEEKKKGRDVFFFLEIFSFERKRKKRKGRTEGRKGKERKEDLIKSWHHQDARDEHVRINDSFFLGRTRDDQHHPKAKGEREREREREHNQSTNHPAKRESDVEHRGVDQKRLLLDALCFLERLFQ